MPGVSWWAAVVHAHSSDSPSGAARPPLSSSPVSSHSTGGCPAYAQRRMRSLGEKVTHPTVTKSRSSLARSIRACSPS